MSNTHEQSIQRLKEILAKPEYAIFQGEWVTKEWGEEHFGDIREGEFVSLCTPELLRYLLNQIAKK
jgi:hypothetical protein